MDNSASDVPTEASADKGQVPLLANFSSFVRTHAKVILTYAMPTLLAGLGLVITQQKWFDTPWSTGLVVAFLLSAFLFYKVYRSGISSPKSGNWARFGAVLMFAIYGILSLYLAIEDPQGEEGWLSFFLGIWVVLVVTLLAFAWRNAEHESSGAVWSNGERARQLFLFGLGGTVFGAGAAVVALGVHGMKTSLTYGGGPLLVEGGLLGLLGLVLLLASRVAACIVMIGSAIVVAGFGVAAILSEQGAFGWAATILGVSGLALAVALWAGWGNLVIVVLLVGGLSAFFAGFDARETGVAAFAWTVYLLAGLMMFFGLLFFSFNIRDWPLGEPAAERSLSPKLTWLLVFACFAVALAMVLLTERPLSQGDLPTVVQMLSLAGGSLAMGLAVIFRRPLSRLSRRRLASAV